MLILRFQRQGKKKDFIFRVVAVDSKIAVNSGKAKEILGWWDPRINKFELKKERILYWLSQGAQPSDSCYNLLVRAKIIEGKKRPISIRKKKIKEEKSEAGEKTSEVPATEEKVEEKSEEKVEEKAKDNKKEVKEEIEEKPKTEEVKEKTEEKSKEKSKEDVKEKIEKEEEPEEKTAK